MSNINFIVGVPGSPPPLVPGSIWRITKGTKAQEISGEEFDYYLVVSKSKSAIPQVVHLNHPDGPKIIDKDLHSFYKYATLVADYFNIDIRKPFV